jgi:hypothetical protein
LLIVEVFSGDQETIGESEIEALKPHVYLMADSRHVYVPCYATLCNLREQALQAGAKRRI